jgi:O-antigen/teichoic acid export membrane protein
MSLFLLKTVTKNRSRRQGTLWLVVATSVLNVLTIVRGLVLVPLYLHFVGGGLYGAWLASGSVVAYLGLCDCGLHSVLSQKVAEAYGAADSPCLARYLGSGLLTVVFLSPLPALAGITCAPHLPQLLGVYGHEAHILKIAFILACCSVSLMIIAHALGGMVCAFQRQLLHGLIWIVAYTIGILITVTLLFFGYGLIALALGVLAQSCLILLIEGAVFWNLQKQILAGSSLIITWKSAVELMKPSGMMFIARGGATLTGQSDNFLIGLIMGSHAVVAYDLTKRAYEMLRLLMGTPIGAFAPALAHFFGELQGETARAKGLAEALIHVSTVIGMVLIGGYLILNRAFVSLWVGPVFYAGDLVMILIGIYGLLSAQTLPLYQIVLGRGRFATAALATGAEGVLRILLILIMARWWGLPGVALAMVLSLAASGWWILGRRYCQDFNISWQEALYHMLPLGVAGVGILTIGLCLRQVATPTTVPAFLLLGGCYLGVASLWVVLVDQRMRQLVADILQRRPLLFPGPT